MKNKIIKAIIIFLVLIPFRLSISILFIKFFKWLIGSTTNENIPNDILATNVILTKVVYNIALSCFFLYTLEKLSREKLGRNARDTYGNSYIEKDFYWWTFVVGILLFVFIIIDAISINEIFFI